ncbi:MAG: DUF3194 domain-containing protein [Candidatus Thorarchaeota archaeon]|nr:MAG: DUF3194 domain-containing protein [Candidatus Thorarchaeota archaeon]
MDPIAEIGLPDLSEDDLEQLVQDCEAEVTNFILGKVPQKSIEEISVVCSLDLDEKLDLEISIEITQKYQTEHNLDEIVAQATQQGTEWIEKRLLEMKSD